VLRFFWSADSIIVVDVLTVFFLHCFGRLQKYENCCVIADTSEAATLPPSESSYSDLGHEEEGEAAQERCAICLEHFENGDNICVSYNSNCQHIFHYECCFEWIVKNDKCPICRRAFLSFVREDEDEDDDAADENSSCNDANQEPHDFANVEEPPSRTASLSDSEVFHGR